MRLWQASYGLGRTSLGGRHVFMTYAALIVFSITCVKHLGQYV
jgi:hypothetical protein